MSKDVEDIKIVERLDYGQGTLEIKIPVALFAKKYTEAHEKELNVRKFQIETDAYFRGFRVSISMENIHASEKPRRT